MVTWNIVMIDDGVGFANTSCTNDIRANLQRLLHVKESRSIIAQQNEDADIHLLNTYHYTRYQQELDFVRKVKKKGKKVVMVAGSDGRWLNSSNLCAIGGLNYTALAAEVDVILSEINPIWKVWGRYQHKVLPLSDPLEHFALTPNAVKDIDFLLVGANGLGGLPYAIETAHMLLDKNPNYKCVIGVAPANIALLAAAHPRLTFESTGPHDVFEGYLKRTKVLINLELKARGGRLGTWAFYAGIPAICGSGAFWSQLYPDLSFDRIDLIDTVNKAEYAHQNSQLIMTKACTLATPFYFENWLQTIYQALGI